MNNSAFDYILDYSKENIKERFIINFNRCSRPVLSWKEECLSTASHIRNSTDRPLMVSMSGGIDAEVAAMSFIEAGIQIEAFTIRHAHGTNEHDISYAIKFCKKYGIKHTIIDVDINKFMEKDFMKYIEMGFRGWDVFRFFQLFVTDTIEQMGYSAILGGGEQVYINNNSEVSLQYVCSSVNIFEWCRKNNTTHFPYFFQTTPEIMLSYITHPYIDKALTEPERFPNKFENYSIEKIMVYHQEWPNLERREKFTGYENVEVEPRINLSKRMFEMFGKWTVHIIPVSRIVDNLIDDKYP
jgi:hypothetical protein